MTNAAMENYNYWRDSRVQSSMFSSCWSIEEAGEREAVISFEDNWISEEIQEEAMEILVDGWIEACEPFTLDYREAQDRFDDAEASKKEVRKQAQKTGVAYWAFSKEARELVDQKTAECSELRNLVYAERGELYKRAAKEIDLPALLKAKGLMPDGTITVPMEYEVCGLCQGSGKTVNPNIDCGGISQEDFDEDPDFEQDYFSGRYDITCTRCRGLRVESIPKFPKWLEKMVDDRDQAQMDNIRDECQERAMGC